ncbi:MAG: L,D-transpeptidase [Beijerinckiaceae bacterium]
MNTFAKTLTALALAGAAMLPAASAAYAYESDNSPGLYFAQEKRIRQAALMDLSRPQSQSPVSTRTIVADPTGKPAGAITINTSSKFLYLSLGSGKAMRYTIGVGRPGFTWQGNVRIGRMAKWPGWTPPPAMLKRRPDLPRHMEGGIGNPLGARAMYLYKGSKDSMFRIHGTNEPDTIGRNVSSGCIRMLNQDVSDLYNRVKIGTSVTVL